MPPATVSISRRCAGSMWVSMARNRLLGQNSGLRPSPLFWLWLIKRDCTMSRFLGHFHSLKRFKDRIADPFIVTIEPKPADTPLFFNMHPGQEFHLVMEGRLFVNIDGKELVLEPGDSLYFDSGKPHGLKALDGKPVKFLAMIMQ